MIGFEAFLRNLFQNNKRYRIHHQAVIISCFYNPQNNPYRLLAFQKWYRSIRHMPHRIIECLIGPNAKSQLPKSPNITQVHTDSLLWHKETLLNKIVRELPPEYKYVFWVDTDILFTNPDWLKDGVKALQTNANIVQPFEYCIHLKRNQLKPDFDVDHHRPNCGNSLRHPQVWRSFAAVYDTARKQYSHHKLAQEHNYDKHGHTGFAWGTRRSILENCPLYEKCFVGGGDHIIAHAAVGQIPHTCISTAFADNIESIKTWSREFFHQTIGQIGFVPGDLHHIWHGDIKARNYFQAVKTFTETAKEIENKDQHGLYIAGNKNQYIKKHYARREARQVVNDGFDGFDTDFFIDMGYNLADLIPIFGQPTYTEPANDQPPLADTDTLPGRFFEIPAAPPVEPAQEPPAAFLRQQEAQEAISTLADPTENSFGSTFS